MEGGSNLLTVDEVAARLRTNPETVRRYLRTGRLKGVRPGGTKAGWRIAVADLDAFIHSPPAPTGTGEAHRKQEAE